LIPVDGPSVASGRLSKPTSGTKTPEETTMAHQLIKRDDIVSRLAEVHRPDLELPETLSNLEWPKIDLSSVDVGKAAREIAVAAHIGGRQRRSRWPAAAGGVIVAALASWVILSNDRLRARLGAALGPIRDRLNTLRSTSYGHDEADRDQPVAFNAAPTAPIRESATGLGDTSATDYPAGLGAPKDETLADLPAAPTSSQLRTIAKAGSRAATKSSED
jgi:hypothetical protein